MPRYFLHIRDGDEFVRDDEGSLHADLAGAIAEAVLGAHDLLIEKIRAGEVLNGQRIEICDDGGLLLEVIRVRDTIMIADD